MNRAAIVLTGLLLWGYGRDIAGQSPSKPSFDYDSARAHEIKPHRRTIPLKGVGSGFNQLHLTLTISPAGNVVDASAGNDKLSLEFWPRVESEVYDWQFTPFEKNDKPVTAEIEEYVDLVPPERLPTTHVPAPTLKSDSKVTITLGRTGCFGSCPSYKVEVSTNGIVFDGGGFVVASEKHTDTVDAKAVRELGNKFIAADFYSMDREYRAGVTDNPTYILSIDIDGHKKEVVDYVGSWVGMPAVISDLEEEVDTFARTERWVAGTDGLVQALQAEKFNFKSFDAQVLLKEAARRGQASTIRELLTAGVPLSPISAPKPKELYMAVPFEHVGWLNAASSHADALQVLIDAGASKSDQSDKDLALANAASTGKLASVNALIAYGANPDADLKKLIFTEQAGGMTMQGNGAGSILIHAAQSGNPEVVREILRYHPDLEARDREGKTAIFAAGDYRISDEDGSRVECVRLLAEAGANVNARDHEGNTPLHEIFLTDVEEELLKLGADVNARNDDGETPIFTNVDDDAIPLYIAHGANLAIQNKDGKTVMEAAEEKGPQRQKALQDAIQKLNHQ